MYEQYYGFRERPFDLTPNPRFLFLTARHREALSTIQYGLSSRKGITLIVGEAGTGKTTLIRAALDELGRPEHCFVHLTNPTLTRAEFYELLASSFGLSAGAAGSKAQFLLEIELSVFERRACGGLSALIIDEAQSLPAGLLEEVRLLANLEDAEEKLLPLLLVGQPELADRLEEPAWQQLKQRVALRAEIGPLDIRETAAYIAGRVRIAGGDVTRVFTRDAVEAIFRHSRGIPRVISVICDNALVTGFAVGARPITRQVVLEVCRDFRFDSEPRNGTVDTAEAQPENGKPASLLALPASAAVPAHSASQAVGGLRPVAVASGRADGKTGRGTSASEPATRSGPVQASPVKVPADSPGARPRPLTMSGTGDRATRLAPVVSAAGSLDTSKGATNGDGKGESLFRALERMRRFRFF